MNLERSLYMKDIKRDCPCSFRINSIEKEKLEKLTKYLNLSLSDFFVYAIDNIYTLLEKNENFKNFTITKNETNKK